MRQQWDAIVIGTGSGGKNAALQLAGPGRAVLAVEAHRFGGECPYVACVPAKALLAAAHGGLSWADAIVQRDDITDGRDDTTSQKSLREAGVRSVRGHAVLRSAEYGVDVDGVLYTAPTVVVATGSTPTIPPIDGLGDFDYWTSDVALSAADQPASMIILGGGAVGCELAQAFALLGTEVHLVEIAAHLLPAEPDWAGDALAARLREDGVQVHLGHEPTSVAPSGAVSLADGTVLTAERILVAGGRDPRTNDLGLDTVGAELDGKALSVDSRCRVLGVDGTPLDGLYAVGDVTGVSTFTHSANYQAKIVALDVTGHGQDAVYTAVPRVVYTEPTVFAVGLTSQQAHDQRITTRTARFDIADVERADLLKHSRPPGKETAVHGGLELIADADRQVLIGAVCVGPEADSWGAELALAIRAEVPLTVLRDHMRAFPTWSEAITATLDELS